MLDIQLENIILVIVGFLNILFSILILFNIRGSRAKIIFALILWNLAIWTWMSIYVKNAQSQNLILSTKILYSIASTIPFLFLLFTRSFLEREEKKIISLTTLLPYVFIILLTLFSGSVIKGIDFEKNNQIIFGSFYIPFSLFILSYFGAGLLNLIIKFKSFKPNSIERTQLKFVLIGVMIPIIISIFTNMFFLYFLNDYTYRWIGPASTLSVTILFYYAISKHHLFNLRIIATELFAGLLILTSFLQFILSKNNSEYIMNGFLFISVIIFGLLLRKSVLREVSDRDSIAQLAGELKKRNIELKKIDKMKSEFLSIASHQLRTPVSSIKGFASMLLEGAFGNLKDNVKEPLTKIYASANQLVTIIDDLLDLSRIETGNIPYEFKKGNFTTLLSSIITEFNPAAEKKNITIEFKNEVQNRNYLFFDKNKLKEAISNLIDNAVKYSEANNKILINLSQRGKNTVLRIRDFGIGISKDYKPKLFTRFSRSEEARRMQPNGMGLGLYFAKKVIEEHKGRIWAESKGAGKGSTFTIELSIKVRK